MIAPSLVTEKNSGGTDFGSFSDSAYHHLPHRKQRALLRYLAFTSYLKPVAFA
jgi:hypothetical protein